MFPLNFIILVPFIGLFWNGFTLIICKVGRLEIARQNTLESHNENNPLNNQNNFKTPLSDEAADDTCMFFTY